MSSNPNTPVLASHFISSCKRSTSTIHYLMHLIVVISMQRHPLPLIHNSFFFHINNLILFWFNLCIHNSCSKPCVGMLLVSIYWDVERTQLNLTKCI